jgi:hypothetical protein
MKFKIDENMPTEIVEDLRLLGHDADSVFDEGLAGADDSMLLPHIRSEQRTMLTMDKGIADVRSYPPQLYAGIILFRPRTNRSQRDTRICPPTFTSVTSSRFSGAFDCCVRVGHTHSLSHPANRRVQVTRLNRIDVN